MLTRKRPGAPVHAGQRSGPSRSSETGLGDPSSALSGQRERHRPSPDFRTREVRAGAPVRAGQCACLERECGRVSRAWKVRLTRPGAHACQVLRPLRPCGTERERDRV